MKIRASTPSDVPLIAAMVRELAEYERLTDHAVATEADFATALFGARPAAQAIIGEWENASAAFALYFYNFSTFLGRKGLYVEDVFVRPEFRRHGIGRAMFRYLAAKAVAENCGRMEWWVLDWNEPAIRFYAGLGATPMTEWTVQRLSGPALEAFAAS